MSPWQKSKLAIRRAFQALGIDVMAYGPMRSHELRRLELMRARDVGLVLDGGAHEGEYARTLRRVGYRGAILSVEPLPSAYAGLRRAAAGDAAWDCENVALSTARGRTTLHENPISQVSSLLEATGTVNTAGWRNTRPVEVAAATIDDVLEHRRHEGALFVKLDIQGFEMQALEASPRTRARAAAIEIELSTVELYNGCVLLPKAISTLDGWGFTLFSSEPALVDYQSARVLQLDCLFVADRPAPMKGV